MIIDTSFAANKGLPLPLVGVDPETVRYKFSKSPEIAILKNIRFVVCCRISASKHTSSLFNPQPVA